MPRVPTVGVSVTARVGGVRFERGPATPLAGGTRYVIPCYRRRRMGLVNRGVVIVKPKQPFLDWLLALPDPASDTTLDELRADPNAYLIPEWDTAGKLERRLKRYCRDIFEEELCGWWTVEDDWSKKRTWPVFSAWFDIECVAMVVNLGGQSVLDDDIDH